MRSSYAFIHARMRFCKHTSLACLRTCPVKESQLCFSTHFKCFKVKLTPCVKSTRATTTLAGLQCSTPRKDVTNRSRSMWQLNFIWQAKSAQAVQATLSTQTLITISSHRTWVWDITRRKDGKYGNTSGTRQTERSDSGSLDSTARASSDVSEMRWSVHHLNTNEKQQDLYFVIIIKMFHYFFIISYIL
jgi:hypothetical protein